MSQAAAAPTTGRNAFAFDNSAGDIVPNSPSRRALLTGFAAASAFAVQPLPALAEGWKDRRTAGGAAGEALSKVDDAPFWRALETYDRLSDQWEAAIDAWPDRRIPDADMNMWGKRVWAAEEAMLRTPVNTLKALYAKILHIRDEPTNYLDDEQRHLVIDAVQWDVERMMMAGGAA